MRLAVWRWLCRVLSSLAKELPTLPAVVGRGDSDAVVGIVALALHVVVAECSKYTTTGKLEDIRVVNVVCV